MKKIIILLILLMAVPSYGLWEITYDNVSNPESLTLLLQDRLGITGGSYAFANGLTIDNATNNVFEWNENSEEIKWTFASNSLTLSSSTGVVTLDTGAIVVTSNQMLFTPVSAAVGTTEGTVYYDSDTDKLFVRDSSAWVDLTAGASGVTDLDTAYNGGNTIDVDGSAVTLTVSDTDNNVVAIFAQNDSTNDPTAVQITSAADAANAISLDIDGQTTGRDIEGTGASFYVEGDGSIVGVDLDVTGAAGITLQNDGTILNDVDGEIQLAEGTEDISFGFGVADTLTMTTDTGVANINWGDLDAWTGLNSMAFDAAASTITLAADGAADDLTISVTGAQDSSLVLSSAGTGLDALQVTASAGGIDIAAVDDIDLTLTSGGAGEDITLSNTGGSITLTATEAAADAIVLNAATAAGGIDITSNADIDITTTGAAGEDITITNTGGSIIVTATENIGDSIHVETNGGTSEGINLYANQGTGASATTEHDASIQLHSDDGGIGLYTTGNVANAIRIEANGGGSETIVIDSAQGTDEAAIAITSTAGGVDIDAAAAKNVAIDGGQVLITSKDNAASAIALTANIGTTETIVVTNTQGTAEGAITLTSTAGGIDADASAGKNIDLSGGQVLISSKDNAASAIALTANVGITETIVVTNTQGTAEGAITLTSTAGGIDMDGAAAKNIDISGGQVLISSKDNAASAIALTANVGTTETIVVTNTLGTDPAAINLTSSAGGITMTADAAQCVGRITLASLITLGPAATFGAADATPDISGSSYWETGGAVTITDFDAGGGTIPEGTVIIVQSLHAVTYDVTASGLTGGIADLVTASGDQTVWVYNAAGDWVLVSFTDQSDDLS